MRGCKLDDLGPIVICSLLDPNKYIMINTPTRRITTIIKPIAAPRNNWLNIFRIYLETKNMAFRGFAFA